MLTAKAFGQRPSAFISGLSGYAAYCLDVAGAVALAYLEQGKKPAVDARQWLGGPGFGPGHGQAAVKGGTKLGGKSRQHLF